MTDKKTLITEYRARAARAPAVILPTDLAPPTAAT